jgi:cytochrome c biogenesis protein CcmG, thiol:disulfide interchange protein DsbE
MQKSLKFFVPLAIFLGIAAFLFRGLSMDPRRVPSPLIDKPAPDFRLPALEDPAKAVDNREFLGKVSLFNVWATWCVSCRAEHEMLMRLAKEDGVQIYGLNYKDTRPEAMEWLRTYGDPYVVNAFDSHGQVGIDYGVYGTPETFVIDKKGTIRYKQIGPITEADAQSTLLPLIQRLKAES